MYEPRRFSLVLGAVLGIALSWPVGAGAQTGKSAAPKPEPAAAGGSVGAAAPAADPPAAAPNAAAPKAAAPNAAVPDAAAKGGQEIKKGTYAVRLRDLEDRINRLKEQIFRSKARLSLLAETVLDRKIAGSKASIVFRNEMGGSFRLIKATFLLDGGPVFNKADETGSLSDREQIDLFDGPVMPGDHTVSVVLNFRGHGYGIFSYLKGYSFKTRSSRTFTVNEGKSLRVEVVAYEKGGVTTPLDERPAVRYVENVVEYQNSEQAQERQPEAQQ
ncbi:MAG: hypothetical protein MUC50_03645 [Myxococcota bacterium]|nr:hypothetical protein [Myxococcota bacterium]